MLCCEDRSATCCRLCWPEPLARVAEVERAGARGQGDLLHHAETLPQGDFITRLTSLSTQVAFSSTLYWVSLVQCDNLSEEVGVNTRLQWVPRAGQEGFMVVN